MLHFGASWFSSWLLVIKVWFSCGSVLVVWVSCGSFWCVLVQFFGVWFSCGSLWCVLRLSFLVCGSVGVHFGVSWFSLGSVVVHHLLWVGMAGCYVVQLSASVQLCVANCSMVQLWFNIGTALFQLNVASFGASVVQLVA